MAAVDVSQQQSTDAEASALSNGLTHAPTPAPLSTVDQCMIDALAHLRPTPARDAAIYHLNTGGHRMRARLALASSAGRLDTHDSTAAAAACELLHNASLIHDDISDHDLYRRGQASVRSLYGDDVALCAGDLLLTTAYQIAAGMRDADTSRRLMAAMADCTARVIGGQSVELAGRERRRPVSRRDYLAATREKTAPLIELALNVGVQTDAGATAPLERGRQLAAAIGLAYQILDDLDDLQTTDNPDRLHPLHAWRHHQPPRRQSGDTRESTLARCLRHVRAALDRAERLTGHLPAPLAHDVRELLQRLADQSRVVSRRALTQHKG
ncbi:MULTISPECIES: polyprenyl synthetase family protein [Spiribacter]|uniref:Polyprenyl diphosphate synthase n=1 Tax=Spiribacter aquaticus TaxID=1935996 RepID=A0A557RFC7_9GAMM|nr:MULTISPECIES: polyprenyl synthetase family protein [Spiribacter]TVO63862.1 polyprenyl diphosphate synthase [Spiribacter aquaticus]